MGNQIKVRIAENSQAAANDVASEFARAIQCKPSLILGLATGGTPVEVYRKLVAMVQNGQVSFSDCTTFNLDEYVGLAPDHHQSYRHFMQSNLFDHVDVRAEKTHVPSGVAEDLYQECEDYEAAIRNEGGIDLQLLGIGENGHIAFNEPGSEVKGRTSVVDLTENTIAANARFFDTIDHVPRKAITMGIGTILEASKIVLMATGRNKATAVARALSGGPGADSPASYLQSGEDVTFVLDADASSELPDALIQSAEFIF